MLRTAIRAYARPVNQSTQRGLVSSVLLTRPYDGKSLSDLRKEAKNRGLSQSGNKTTLVSRMQAEDRRRALEEMMSSQVAAPQRARGLSSSATVAAQPASGPEYTRPALDKIPDLSQALPESPVQIPFAPDFWESSKVNAAEAAAKAEAEELPAGPKIITIAGESTHNAGGPSHNLYQASEHSESDNHKRTESSSSSPSNPGFWQDVSSDLGLPTSFSLRKAGHEAEAALLASLPDTESTPSGQQKEYSRRLDGEEKKGLWVLLGLLAGSWVVGGIASPASDKREKQSKDSKNS